MLVLSRRLYEKILFPGFDTSVQVVGIKPGQVRLGIEAPEEVRVLREEVPDRVAEWGPAPEPEFSEGPPALIRLNQLLKKRLEIARRGLSEVRAHLRAGRDAGETLAHLEEDLQSLQLRFQREVERTSFLLPVADAEDNTPPRTPVVRRPK